MIKKSSDPIFPLEAQIQDSSERTSDSAILPDEQDPEDYYFDTIEPTKVFIPFA